MRKFRCADPSRTAYAEFLQEFYMKRVSAAAAVCLFLLPAFAQQSLQSTATNRVVENPNDWVLFPGENFNHVSSDYVIAFTDFTPASSGGSTAAVPGGFFGYHRHAAFPFTVGASFRMTAAEEVTKTVRTVWGGSGTTKTETVTETEYVTPAFDTYYANVFFLIGVPQLQDLSAGLQCYLTGSETITDKYTQTVTVNGVRTDYRENAGILQQNASLLFVVPASYRIGTTVNNSSFGVSVVTSKTEDAAGSGGDTGVNFFLYHKIAFKSLIPGGTRTNVWAAGGNKEFSCDLLEPTPFAGGIQKKTMFQLGISNRYDYSLPQKANAAGTGAPAFTAAFNPKAYADLIVKDAHTFDLGITVAADIGLNAALGSLPLTFFIGMTPRVYYREQAVKKTYPQTSSSYEQYGRARDFRADILWSGKIGMSVLLPKNWVCDVTFNVDTDTKLTGISAQLTIPVAPAQKAK